MFNEDEDWSDGEEAQRESALRTTQKTNSSPSFKPKVVGKKSLLRTLQTLGAVPEWKSDSHQQSSDSEAEAPPSHSKKKKKKRRKKRKSSAEEHDISDLDQSVKEEKPATKKQKKEVNCVAQKGNTLTAGDITTSKPMEENKMENTKQLSRQQWKNKMKNKRKCKNKYRQNNPEEEVHKIESVEGQGRKEEVKSDVFSKDSRKKITQTVAKKKNKDKPQKLTKQPTEEADIQTQSQQTHQDNNKNSSGAGKGAVKSAINGSKQKTVEVEEEIKDNVQNAKKLKPELSKEQIHKRDRLRKMLQSQKPDRQLSPVKPEPEPEAPQKEHIEDSSASLRSRMEQRLESARFRYINEVLYSTSSGEAKRMFKQDPQAFWIYHRGYTAQVLKWPANPVDAIIAYICQKSSSLVVADFGCGDCKIARSVSNTVHCFDLAATCDLVTVCDMANVPLSDGSVDIAVFCLSLMGTNLADFIAEANRVLKMGGVLKISEVASRFENVRSFVNALAKLGFKLVSKDTENTHFYSFDFLKTGSSPENVKKFGLQLRPCVYKKR